MKKLIICGLIILSSDLQLVSPEIKREAKECANFAGYGSCFCCCFICWYIGTMKVMSSVSEVINNELLPKKMK